MNQRTVWLKDYEVSSLYFYSFSGGLAPRLIPLIFTMRVVPEEVMAEWSRVGEVEEEWTPEPEAAREELHGDWVITTRTPWMSFHEGDGEPMESDAEHVEVSDDEVSDDTLPALIGLSDDEPADAAPMPDGAGRLRRRLPRAESEPSSRSSMPPFGHAWQLAATVPRYQWKCGGTPWGVPAPVHPCMPCMHMPMPPPMPNANGWLQAPMTPGCSRVLPTPVAAPSSHRPQVPPPTTHGGSPLARGPTTPVYQEALDPFAGVRNRPTPVYQEEPPPIRRPPSYPPIRPPPFYPEESAEVCAKRVVGELRYNARVYELAIMNDGWIAFDELRSLKKKKIADLEEILCLVNKGKKRVEHYYHYADGTANTVSIRIMWSSKAPWVTWATPDGQ